MIGAATKLDAERAPLGDMLADVLARAERVLVDPATARRREIELLADQIEQEMRARGARLRSSGVALEGEILYQVENCTLNLAFGTSVRAIVRWLERPDRPTPLVLCGGMGCGKSIAAAWALAGFDGSLARSATQVSWSWQSSTARALDERARLADCRLLLLDDLGTEHDRDRDHVTVALRDLLELRQRPGLLTIITTNLDQAKFFRRFNDPRIASRMARAAWVMDRGPDHRKRRSP